VLLLLLFIFIYDKGVTTMQNNNLGPPVLQYATKS